MEKRKSAKMKHRKLMLFMAYAICICGVLLCLFVVVVTKQSFGVDNKLLRDNKFSTLNYTTDISSSSQIIESSLFVPSNTCWSNGAFGDAWDWSHTKTWEMTRAQCSATETNRGGAGMDFRKASQQLHNCQNNGRGLNVLIVGGSITTGYGKNNDPRVLAGFEKAWPAQLEIYLNTHYKCGNRHQVINRSERSVASDHWLSYFLAARQDIDHGLHTSDVIILETASNDFQNWHKPPYVEVTKYVELILRLLRQLPHKPVVIWVTVGWRDAFKTPPLASCSESQHLPIMKHYDIPHVSMLQAYAPVTAYTDFLIKYYFADMHSHLTILGHQLTAGVVGTRLSRQLTVNNDFTHVDEVYSMPRAIGLDHPYDTYWQAMLSTIDNQGVGHQLINSINFRGPHHLVTNSTMTTQNVIAFNQGWKFQEDVTGKPGLISHEVGSKLVLMLSNNLPADSNEGCAFTLGLMKSYQNMGSLLVRIWVLRSVPESKGGMRSEHGKEEAKYNHMFRKGMRSEHSKEEAKYNPQYEHTIHSTKHGGMRSEHSKEEAKYNPQYETCDKSHWNAPREYQRQAYSKVIDTLWDTQASVKDVENMAVKKLYTDEKAPCVFIEIEVRASKPIRTENKVKLLDLKIVSLQ